MNLRGIEFGNVLGASGVQGFFGEGYWFHLDSFEEMEFVAKTATLLSNKGNAPLTRDYTLRELFPSCIKVKFLKSAMVNAVGLSNPGLGALLGTGNWQARTKPFWISVMSRDLHQSQRIQELRMMVDMLAYYKGEFKAPFGLQINLSCPNTGHDLKELISESEKVLDIAATLGVPLMPKYSIATAPIEAIRKLQDHPHCDAICVSNTVPFGWKGIDWKKAWGSNVSPLAHLGGGGYSGKELGPLVREWIARLRDAGFTRPINGGGGILCCNDVTLYRDAGASSVFLGSVIPLNWYNPWRVNAIINYANNLTWK